MDCARAAGALYPDWRPGESQSGAVEQYSHGHNTAATLHASLAITHDNTLQDCCMAILSVQAAAEPGGKWH